MGDNIENELPERTAIIIDINTANKAKLRIANLKKDGSINYSNIDLAKLAEKLCFEDILYDTYCIIEKNHDSENAGYLGFINALTAVGIIVKEYDSQGSTRLREKNALNYIYDIVVSTAGKYDSYAFCYEPTHSNYIVTFCQLIDLLINRKVAVNIAGTNLNPLIYLNPECEKIDLLEETEIITDTLFAKPLL